MHLIPMRNLLIAAVAAGGLAFTGTVFAQPPATPSYQTQPQMFDDQEISRFVNASQEVAEIRIEYAERLQAVESHEKAHALQEEANSKMVDVVEENGLDVNTYNAIARAAEQDPQLMQRIQSAH